MSSLILNYAGRDPAVAQSSFAACWRVVSFVIVFSILLVYVTLRAAVLLAGFACVFVGTILLTLGGRRSAGAKLRDWRWRAADHARLWTGDLLRPLRRWRASRSAVPVATPVAPVAAPVAP